MLVTTLSLLTAASTLALSKPLTTNSDALKDVFEKCTIIRDHRGDTIYDCPGCTLIIDNKGRLKLRTGEECHKYRKDPDEDAVSKPKNCQIVKEPNGDTLIQCPGCQKIIDKNGKTKLEQGPNCKHDKDDMTLLLGEIYESGQLLMQEP